MAPTPDVVRQIRGLFPESLHYIEQISFEKTFESSAIKEHILGAQGTDELAQHLLCSPHFLVISRDRNVSPKEGAFYVRAFEGKIALSDMEKRIYKTYYPTEKFLLIAPLIPEAAMLSTFLATGATARNVEEVLA